MTPATLRNCSYKDLAQMAKVRGVPGWHSMRKDQLVQALSKQAKPSSANSPARRAATSKASSSRTSSRTPAVAKKAPAAKPTRVQKQINQLQAKLERAKNLASETQTPAGAKSGREVQDRLVVMVRDPYWLHVYWELSRQTIVRVQAAMGQHWHTAKPQLRLFQVSSLGLGAASDTLERSIDIHGGVSNWYVDVQDPPKSYRLEIGYVASDGNFFTVARSNVVATPSPAARDAVDENWSDVAVNLDKIYALSGGYSPEGTSQELQELLEERLRRPMGASPVTRYGAGLSALLERNNNFHFDADAELIVYGSSKPGAHVTLQGEPVQLRPDGTFTMRLNLPDRRQVIPIVASSSDGAEQRTIVIAVERNTKRMETLFRDSGA